MSELTFIGLDIETTGTDPAENHRTIQVGACTLDGTDSFVADIRRPLNDASECAFDPKAMAVNGFSFARIAHGSYERMVDAELHAWLCDRGGKRGERLLVAVGWNVGGFDMPFVKRDLPFVSCLFSRRTVDLNAVCFTIGQAAGLGWGYVKDCAKAYAADRLANHPGGAHDAGWDAAEAVHCWQYLQATIRGGVL